MTFFLTFSLIPIIIFSIVIYYVVYNDVLQEQKSFLILIAKDKIKKASTFFDELEKTALTVAHSNNVLAGFEKEPEAQRAYLNYVALQYGLSDLYLIKKDGEILFSLENSIEARSNLNSGIYQFSELTKSFHEVEAQLKPVFSQFSYFDPIKKPAAFIAVPVIVDGHLIGVFAIQIPAEQIYHLFEDYTGLRQSGEILVGKVDKGKALFINHIRHLSRSEFNFKVEFGSPIAIPMQKAVVGFSGSGIVVDYRGEKVLAVWDYFSYLQLGIVIKIDLKEALATVRVLFKLITIFMLLIIIIVVLVVIYLARSISKPIEKLRNGIKIIGDGDLEHRVGTNTKDEIGYLSRAFDQTIESLRTSVISVERLNLEVERREKAEALKAHFFAIASHELRGPIGPINGCIEIVLQEKVGALNKDQIKLLTAAQHSSHHLLVIINDILDYGKLEVGKMKYEIKPNNVNDLLKEACKLVHIMLEEKGLQLELDFAKQPIMVACDYGRIIQVMTNLLNNAIKFTDHGQIRVKCTEIEGFARIEVCDTGLGIAASDIHKLFISFSQLKQKYLGGTGLGLAICKLIISDHGGKIWVESELGKGSSFIFTLPKI